MNELVPSAKIEAQLTQRLNDLVNQFLLSQDIRPQSKSTYRRSLKQFTLWMEQGRIQNPTRETILAFKSYLEKKGLSASTLSNYIVAVRKWFEWLEGMKLYPNIARGIKGAKQPKGFRRDPLTVPQILELFNNIDKSTLEGKRNFSIINLAVRTAVRSIEIVRANIGDISQKSGVACLYVQGKARDSKDEIVVLTHETLKPIMEYLKARGKVNDDDPLFASLSDRNKGQRLTTRSISKIVKDRLRAINLDTRRLTAHSLRHSAITLLLKGNGTLEEGRMLARHASLDTTAIYAHHLNRVEDAPERKIDAVLQKGFTNSRERNEDRKENAVSHNKTNEQTGLNT